MKPAEKVVELNDGQRLEYDYLVITTGPKLAFDEVPGLGPEVHTQSVCTLSHAERPTPPTRSFSSTPGRW